MKTKHPFLTQCSLLLLSVFLCTSLTFAKSKTAKHTTYAAMKTKNFVAGEDYELIKNAPNRPSTSPQVEVIEFFSFGCPACYYLESYLEQWLVKKANTIQFSRIPVVFEPEWQMYAKAFYAAEALNINEKVAPAIFKAVQEDHEPLQSEADLEKFFTNHGIKADDFESVFRFSPRIDAQVNRGIRLMKEYQVTEIPTLIVGNKYKTTGRMARTRERLMDIVDFLIQQAKSEQTKQTSSKKT